MKLISTIAFLLFLNRAFGQEVTVEVSLLDMFIEPVMLKEVLIMRSNEISLGVGQWTDVDRSYNQPRFQEAMEYIALNNRTDLLSYFSQIIYYYSYLDNHPIVRKFGIKWQNEAAALTGDLHLMPAAIGAGFLTGTLFVKLAEMSEKTNKNEAVYAEVKRLLDEGISPIGLDFINGTASKVIVADVTKNYYSLLLKGKKSITDAFEFDAGLLYREQFEIVQSSYYAKFNDLDNILIVGWYAKGYALLTDLDILSDLSFLLNPKLELKNPKDRFVLGLKRMGYSDEKINAYLNRIKK